ncbi:hypothetical protein CesoFtcFv8_018007 [Champsocephalus esox]|uniref:KASH domain-containing protein n=1 Tax=Champsocephalus esox TaxID=159716 RepID=A0AAN8GPP8_9TELE|nr:hypothetical protein CesoFtcFv8_018007 [Champsocephalus esox]
MFLTSLSFRFLSAAGSGSSRSDPVPWRFCSSWFRRVLLVSLPFQIFLLLLVFLSFLLPLTEEDFCSQSNNFLHSFSPMLSYTNPPPV